MPNVYRSAQGRVVDIEKLRLANEETIAVGNMRVNARGDQLGPGGKIVKTRNQIMKEYYSLNTPVSVPSRPVREEPPVPTIQADPVIAPVAEAVSNSPLDQEMAEWDAADAEEEKPKRTKK